VAKTKELKKCVHGAEEGEESSQSVLKRAVSREPLCLSGRLRLGYGKDKGALR